MKTLHIFVVLTALAWIGQAAQDVIISTVGTSAQAAPVSFSEDFSANVIPSNMSLGTPYGTPATNFVGDFTVTSGDDDRIYLGTNETDYASVDFTLFATVTVSTNAWGVAFFGLGASDSDAGFFGEPEAPGTFGLISPSSFQTGFFQARVKDPLLSTPRIETAGGDGTHRVRLVWNATSKLATFDIDSNYAGGTFTPDAGATLTRDASGVGFDSSNASIFFGGGNQATWDDIEVTVEVAVVPEPSSFLLLCLGALGLVRHSRRR